MVWANENGENGENGCFASLLLEFLGFWVLGFFGSWSTRVELKLVLEPWLYSSKFGQRGRASERVSRLLIADWLIGHL